MENVLEGFYMAAGVLVFCIAAGVLILSFRGMDRQVVYTKMNLYDQHMLSGAYID